MLVCNIICLRLLQIFPAVLRALKSCVVRLALTQELNHHVLANRAMLEQQQFDLVVRLLNCALQVCFQPAQFLSSVLYYCNCIIY